MRNPFRLRAAQRAVSDDDFVRLFGAGALDLINEIEDPWGGLVFLRSALGGGKTSFLRLLTPRPLKIASLLHDDTLSRPTYDALKEHHALEDGRPVLLGVFATFTNEYRDLEEIDLGGGMFRALLNARIVIATVRAILERGDKSYPKDLASIKTHWKPDTSATIPAEATGKELFEWASEIERGFYGQLDELGDGDKSGPGHTRLDALNWFAQADLEDDHGPIKAKRVLLLDDLQFLSTGQRRSLTDLLINARANCGIWVAERMEALSHQEILGEGALKGRDYQGVIRLESQWARRLPAYTKFVSQIAELRARRADGFSKREFFSLIDEHEDVKWHAHFKQAAKDIRSSIEEMVKRADRYQEWIDAAKAYDGGVVEKAVRWRTTQVLVARDLARKQSSFGFDHLTVSDYDSRDSPGVNRAAEHFLRCEIGAPIYYGKETLAAVSSTNVDQYLDVGGDLFEEVAASIAGPRSNPSHLSADRQHALIKGTAKKRWDEIARRLPQGYDARRFLDALGVFCQLQTNRPTAPYAPGVTGFGLPMEERARLIDNGAADPTPYVRLRDVLTTLVAHNLLAPRLEHKNKGREYVVFYLNRLLCAHFNLPLGYGGWRDQSLRDLSCWAVDGRRAVKEGRLVE